MFALDAVDSGLPWLAGEGQTAVLNGVKSVPVS